MTSTDSVEATLAKSDELADMCEAFDPSDAPLLPSAEYWLLCAARRATATGTTDLSSLAPLVAETRESGTKWYRIGELLGIGAEAAHEQFG
ncbi:hypothetical protein [Candidatus Poriferisodalis sp.]|uniref:hypothetical protein n=1 Tax=Candidatus Poriferisodalis sp. TaxID=3101277 RepID=UPI003B01CC27